MLADTHTHSVYSFDGHDSVDEICLSAIDKGLSGIVITDHCDIDCEEEGIYPKLKREEAKADIAEAKEKYKDKLSVGIGIELGQPFSAPDDAKNLLASGYDFVLGSVHNLFGVPDFAALKYTAMPPEQIDSLYRRYLNDIDKLVSFDGIDVITHATYPLRYISRQGIVYDVMKHKERYEELFAKIIASGKALEYNVTGLRRNEAPSPTPEIMKLYRAMGGENVAVGSDAHFAKDVGSNIADAYEFLASLGFRYVTAYVNGKTKIKIGE